MLDDFLGTWTCKRGNAEIIKDGDTVLIAHDGDNQVSLTWTRPSQATAFLLRGEYDEERDVINYSAAMGMVQERQLIQTPLPVEGQISVFVSPNSSYKALYAVNLAGDPEEAGVWGGEQDGG